MTDSILGPGAANTKASILVVLGNGFAGLPFLERNPRARRHIGQRKHVQILFNSNNSTVEQKSDPTVEKC